MFDLTFKISEDIENTENFAYENKSSLLKSNSNKHDQGVYLAFTPLDQKWLISGDIEICLINNTKFTIIYSIFFEDEDKFEGYDYDVLEPETKKNITTFSREEINNWNKGFVQVLFHFDKQKKLLMPINASFNIKSTRFLSESNYINNFFLQEKTLLVTLCRLSEVEFLEIKSKEEVLKENNIITTKNSKNIKNSNFLEKHLINPSTAEIDLHISELVEDSYLLEKSEILDIQLNYFNRCLEEAILNKIPKLIVIHGVGNGTLKNEIIKVLKNYDNVHYFDASIAKYGTGATEIFLKY